MRTIRLTVLDEKAGRPLGNPFQVRPVSVGSAGYGMYNVRTGLSLGLNGSSDLTVRMRSLVQHVYILDVYTSMDGKEELCALVKGDSVPDLPNDQPFAEVSLQISQLEHIRFIEMKDGSRVILGEPEKTNV